MTIIDSLLESRTDLFVPTPFDWQSQPISSQLMSPTTHHQSHPTFSSFERSSIQNWYRKCCPLQKINRLQTRSKRHRPPQPSAKLLKHLKRCQGKCQTGSSYYWSMIAKNLSKTQLTGQSMSPSCLLATIHSSAARLTAVSPLILL